MTGPLALVGSGEYLPVMQPLERRLLEGRAPKYVQIPTAAAEEGQASLDRWVALGLAQGERLRVEAVPVMARTRADADDPALADLVRGAGLVYLSGGSPSYLAATLRGTRLWRAVCEEWEGGAALAGCSAGAMALTGSAPHVRDLAREPEQGLGVLPSWHVLPHFDRIGDWEPGIVERYLASLADDETLIGIDEETGLVRMTDTWEVQGRQAVHVIRPDGQRAYTDGASVPL
ncbi:MAG TPA: Type 1 glutamine amidotransferase-like domain-containing protein [Mycobacteriales bacterium]|nr:Type 1 glutamine amidotransferase-like domain-containing protein [Mycobacteriales bacterium]